MAGEGDRGIRAATSSTPPTTDDDDARTSDDDDGQPPPAVRMRGSGGLPFGAGRTSGGPPASRCPRYGRYLACLDCSCPNGDGPSVEKPRRNTKIYFKKSNSRRSLSKHHKIEFVSNILNFSVYHNKLNILYTSPSMILMFKCLFRGKENAFVENLYHQSL